MLPKKLRLTRSEDIRDTIASGRRFVTDYMTVYVLPSEAQSAQVACVVGKKVHKSAVVRHRYKRLLATVARELYDFFPYNSKVVVVGRPRITSITNQDQLLKDIPLVKQWLQKLQSL